MMNWTADFPILAADENGNRLVYLDSAATTQHPMQVLNAVVDYYTKENANPHRGVYELAMRATDAHEGARHTVAQFFNAEDDEIVFTQNTTESLNLVAYSYGMNFLHEGDEIVISVAEHHSNMVPWQRVAKATGAKLVYMYPGENGRLTTEELDKKITPKTKVVAVAMVSNVLGLRAPVEEIVKRAHAVGAVVVLDCAQSAPHTPVDVKKLDVDFVAFSGHKMLAPMGIGVLYGKQELLEKMPPFLTGGEMIETVSRYDAVYAELPHKFEAGTVNAGGAVGLAAAIDYLESYGMDTLHAVEQELTAYLFRGMNAIPHVHVLGSQREDNHTGIVSFTVDQVHPHDISEVLSSDGMDIRAGHHCAQPLHDHLGIHSTARASLMFYNTKEEIDRFLESVSNIRRRMGFGNE